MKRDEFEEHLQRMEADYLRRLEKVQNLLKDAGLEIKGDVVRYTDRASNMAPTWEAQRLAQIRSYEARTRAADVKQLALDGVDAVIEVHNRIEANQPMPPALENGLREFQEKLKEAGLFMMGKQAGYSDPRY